MKKYLVIILILLSYSLSKASNRVTPISEAVKLTHNSVVNIRTEKIISKNYSPFHDPFFDDFFGFSNSYKTQSIGSGVIISKDGLIITNSHVIEAANKIFVIMHDNNQYEAEVIGADQTLDIAIIKVKNKISDLKPAKLGKSSDIMLGETVIAMGNPYGLNSSVTTGVVSNVKRVVGNDYGFSIYIQTDAMINPGNSGGPLINLDGEVIGVNTAIYKEAQGIGFSIPIDTIKRAIPEFLAYGKIRKGYPGFTIREVKFNNQLYLEVTSVAKNSNAEQAGIKPYDKLLTLDNIPINTSNAFKYIIKTFPTGQDIQATLKRDNKIRNITLTMDKLPKNYGLQLLNAIHGITVKDTQQYLIVTTSKSSRYIQPSDIVLAINNNEIISLKQFSELLNEYINESIILTLARNNKIFNIQLQL